MWNKRSSRRSYVKNHQHNGPVAEAVWRLSTQPYRQSYAKTYILVSAVFYVKTVDTCGIVIAVIYVNTVDTQLTRSYSAYSLRKTVDIRLEPSQRPLCCKPSTHDPVATVLYVKTVENIHNRCAVLCVKFITIQLLCGTYTVVPIRRVEYSSAARMTSSSSHTSGWSLSPVYKVKTASCNFLFILFNIMYHIVLCLYFQSQQWCYLIRFISKIFDEICLMV